MSYETLSLAIENRVATITINRPKMMNAFNEQLIWDMGDATEQVKNDSAIRVLVITCLLYTSPSPRDMRRSRMPSSA